MKVVHIILFSLLATAMGYNINHEQSSVYKKAIQDTLKKKPVMKPTKTTGSSTFPLPQKSSSLTTYDERDGLPRAYWFHPQIHTFGNTGFLGALHAFIAPLATKLIDVTAYDGENIRYKIARDLRRIVGKAGANVADLCCGVGISTRALRKSFGDANAIVGLDTSPEMIRMAEALSGNNLFAKLMGSNDSVVLGSCDASYTVANAEKTNLPSASFDLVTIMYAFHEAPYFGRFNMLKEARRLLAPGGTLAVVDISPDYKPSKTMLAGEPYVLEYKKNIQNQLRVLQGFTNFKYEEVVEGHVGMWLLKKRDIFNTRGRSSVVL